MTAAWRHRECDVLVVGAGAAGLRAAIAAGSAGARVAVACKSLLGKAGTLLATGDVADLAREAPERIEELRSWGALFAGARVGLEVLRTLQHRAVAQENVDIHMECAILRLFVAKGRIMGALGVRRATGELVLFRCKAVVLAAGSAARAWKKNSGTADATGDAFALALRAGAELADMELAQFEPDGRYRHGPGGIRVHPETAQTCVAGLYAAGDAALESHSLAGALVSGQRAGLHAGRYAGEHPWIPLSLVQIEEAGKDVLRPLSSRSGGESPYTLLHELQACMQAHVGPVRSVQGLTAAQSAVAALKERAGRLAAHGPREWNPAWHLSLELDSLLLASEATVRSALARLAETTHLRDAAHG